VINELTRKLIARIYHLEEADDQHARVAERSRMEQEAHERAEERVRMAERSLLRAFDGRGGGDDNDPPRDG
jgi:hypothetical protein